MLLSLKLLIKLLHFVIYSVLQAYLDLLEDISFLSTAQAEQQMEAVTINYKLFEKRCEHLNVKYELIHPALDTIKYFPDVEPIYSIPILLDSLQMMINGSTKLDNDDKIKMMSSILKFRMEILRRLFHKDSNDVGRKNFISEFIADTSKLVSLNNYTQEFKNDVEPYLSLGFMLIEYAEALKDKDEKSDILSKAENWFNDALNINEEE